MKILSRKLALSCAVAFVSNGALAGLLPGHNPSNGFTYFAGGAQVDYEINIAGSSAADIAFKKIIANLCQAGTLTTFTDQCQTGTASSTSCGGGVGKTVGSSYSAYFCTIDHTKVANMAADESVLFRKCSSGGSFQGTLPVAYAQTSQSQMFINDTNCGATADSSIYKCSNSGLSNYPYLDIGVGSFTGAAAIPDMGISISPPNEFVTPNVPTGSTACGSDCVNNLDALNIAALTTGIIVDSKLYVALQKAQGLNSDSNGDGIDDATQQAVFAANDALQSGFVANMPNLASSQLASLLAGKIGNWNKVFYKNVALNTTTGVVAPADSRVFVCRGVAGSGVQADINAQVMNVPCSGAADSPAIDNTTCLSNTGIAATLPTACSTATWANPVTPTSTTTPVIHEASGSGDLDNCMQGINDAGKWSVGLMALNRSPITQGNSKWAFIKIDGVEPTLANVATNRYPLWGSLSIQWRNKSVNQDNNPGSPIVAAPAGDLWNIITQIRQDMSAPSFWDTINTSLTYPFSGNAFGEGNAGGLDLINTTIRPFNASAPVMQYTRSNKTCNPAKPISSVTGLGVDFGN